jgi:hypothetical protein
MQIQFISHYIIWYILLAIIGIAAGIFSYRSSYPPLLTYQRILLACLRTLMIILLGIFLLEPLISLTSSKKIEPKLAVLMDVSKSMGVKDSSISRIARANELTGKAISAIKAGYHIFDFAQDLDDSNRLPKDNDLAGDATSIANALQDYSIRKDIDDYGAILLVTDGRQNLGEDPTSIAARLGHPIYTLTLGKQVQEKNLAIDRITYPAVAYSGDDIKVETEISAIGLPEGKTKAILRLGSNVQGDKAFDIPQEGRKTQLSFVLKAPEPGNYEYSLTTPILEGEANKVDNERVFAIRVLKNKLKILLTAPRLDWEFKFLRQALAQYDEFQVDAVYPEANGNFSNPGSPRGLEGLEKYDIVMLVNCSPADVRIATPELKQYVDKGHSLIYVAGDNSTDDIMLFDGLLPLKPISPRISQGEFFYEPVALKKQHAAIMLGNEPDISLRNWHSLPPFSNLLSGFEVTGDVLLEASFSPIDSTISHSQKKSGVSGPLLIAGNHGKGRVAAITGFPWWSGYFGSVRDPKMAKVMPEFWHNLVKWASATDQMGNFNILTDRKVYRLGEPVNFTGYLYDEANRPKNGAYIAISLSADSSDESIKEIVLSPVDAGIYSESVSSLGPARYQYKAIASAYGDTLGKTDGEFTIESFSLEMASSSPDYNLTRRISEATGGKAYDETNFADFPAKLKLASYIKEDQATFKPFGKPWLLGILILGLCIEWGLRKRYRLP